MPVPTYLSTMLLVCARPRLLVSVYKSWHGIGVWYVLFFLAVVHIPIALYGGFQFHHFFGGNTPDLSPELQLIVDQIPTIYLENGTLEVRDTTQPVTVLSTSGTPVVTIDTRGTQQPTESTAPLQIERHRVTLQLYDQNRYLVHVPDLLEAFKLPPDATAKIDRTQLMAWLMDIKTQSHMLPLAAYAGGVIGRTVDHMTWSLVMCFALLAIASLFNMQLQFIPALRTTVVAGTAVMVLKLLPALLGAPIFVYEQTVYVILHGLYLYLALEALRQQEPLK